MRHKLVKSLLLTATLTAGINSTALAADAVEYNYTSPEEVPLCLKDAPQILRSLNASTPANQVQEDTPLIFPRSSHKTQLEQLLEDVNNSPETGMLQWMHNDTDKPFSGTMSSEPDELLIFPRTSNETWADWLFSGKGTPDPYDFYQSNGSEGISNTAAPDICFDVDGDIEGFLQIECGNDWIASANAGVRANKNEACVYQGYRAFKVFGDENMICREHGSGNFSARKKLSVDTPISSHSVTFGSDIKGLQTENNINSNNEFSMNYERTDDGMLINIEIPDGEYSGAIPISGGICRARGGFRTEGTTIRMGTGGYCQPGRRGFSDRAMDRFNTRHNR